MDPTSTYIYIFYNVWVPTYMAIYIYNINILYD